MWASSQSQPKGATWPRLLWKSSYPSSPQSLALLGSRSIRGLASRAPERGFPDWNVCVLRSDRVPRVVRASASMCLGLGCVGIRVLCMLGHSVFFRFGGLGATTQQINIQPSLTLNMHRTARCVPLSPKDILNSSILHCAGPVSSIPLQPR